MTVSFEEICEIRFMYRSMNTSITDLCKKYHRDYRTIRKYLELDDFNEPDKCSEERESKLDKWKPIIDEWLKNDMATNPKQRHTSVRVHARLKEECPGFNCSYGTVNAYVKKKKAELKAKPKKKTIPLDCHDPGVCQADFGKVEFEECGKRIEGKEFVLSFPYSNASFSVLNYGENTECLLEGLDCIFRFIGGVPSQIWFDNASTMVLKVIFGGKRKMTERFRRFCEHYRFDPVFMNIYAGNEKGNVEAHVGILRRNMFVPVPQFDDLDQYNQETLQGCMRRIENNDHYIHKIKMIDLFREDLKQLHPLPNKKFDLSTLTSYMTGATGLFKIDDYTYSASPEYESKRVYVRLTSSEVTVLKEDLTSIIVVHKRLYGLKKTVSIQWGPYLREMSRKPRSFLNSSLREQMPYEMRQYLFRTENNERGLVLGILADINDECGFEAVEKLCDIAAEKEQFQSDKLERLARQLFGYKGNNSPVSRLSEDNDLKTYDALLKIGMEQWKRRNRNE